MGYRKRLSAAFSKELSLPLKLSSKYIIFSDCHRSAGQANDNFLKNELLFLAALQHYFQRGFSYIELGDGDELWEGRSMKKIKEMHKYTFEQLADFYQHGRLYMVYGNHDMVKKDAGFCKKHMEMYYNEKKQGHQPFCPAICCYEGIILKDEKKGRDIYLTHGHQAELFNSVFWKLSRFLVRYMWKNLELLGIPDPTSAAKNYTRKEKTERRLSSWAYRNRHILITGHTHRPMMGTKESPYFNTGSCVHPMSITGIEIENRCITLVKWTLSTRQEQAVYVRREVLSDTVCIDEYV